MDRQELRIRLYGERVGVLKRLDAFTMAFSYDEAYRSDASNPPLSAALRLQRDGHRNARRATNWFEGLLPEGMRRWRLAKVLGTTEIDSWTMLLAIAGECAGAVQVGGEEHGDGSGKMPLVDGDLERLLYGFPMDSFAYLSRGARISIAGAQDKAVLVREKGGGWSVPLGGAPSTHILKPESEEFPGLVENEWYCMELARKAGLETACVDVEVIGGKRVLVVERYDRGRSRAAGWSGFTRRTWRRRWGDARNTSWGIAPRPTR